MSRQAPRTALPTRDGVGASCVSLPAGPWTRLLDFLHERMPAVGLAQWQARMAQGLVLLEDGTALSADAPYRPHTRVYYYRSLPPEPPIPFEEELLYQDEHLLVADKPHFLPVTPTGRYVQETLLVRLKRRTGLEQLVPVHRIDRETAGLVLFSVRPEERGAYHACFHQREVLKTYEAIAPHHPELPLPRVHKSRMAADAQFFRQREVPGEPNSETQIELLETRGNLARYRLQPLSGRTHQLRVHMLALGRPILGDLLYPEVVHGPDHVTEDFSRPLQLLAQSIAFVDPVTGHERLFESRRQLIWPK